MLRGVMEKRGGGVEEEEGGNEDILNEDDYGSNEEEGSSEEGPIEKGVETKKKHTQARRIISFFLFFKIKITSNIYKLSFNI